MHDVEVMDRHCGCFLGVRLRRRNKVKCLVFFFLCSLIFNFDRSMYLNFDWSMYLRAGDSYIFPRIIPRRLSEIIRITRVETVVPQVALGHLHPQRPKMANTTGSSGVSSGHDGDDGVETGVCFVAIQSGWFAGIVMYGWYGGVADKRFYRTDNGDGGTWDVLDENALKLS